MAKLLADLDLRVAVALCTCLGCGLVEEHWLAIYIAPEFMATGTRNVLMGAFQGETGIPIMIEAGGYPAGRTMAVRARRWCACAGELTAVLVLVTPFTVFRCIPESRFSGGRSRRSRVALDTGHRAMRASQRELRLGVVKPYGVPPRLHRVTSLAVSASAVCQDAVHLGLVFAVVRIHVTTRAGLVGEVELHRSGSRDQGRLVTV
jgi:hypothetical protein